MRENEKIDQIEMNDYNSTSEKAEANLKKAQAKNTLFVIAIIICVVCGIIFQNIRANANLDYIEGNILRIARTGSASVGNPWKNDSFVTQLAYASLFETDASFTEVNEYLAEKFEVSPDGLTYKITLKDSLKWSDGQPLTAQDIVFSIEAHVLNDNANLVVTTAFEYIKGVEEWRKVGLESWENGGTHSLEGVYSSGNVVTIELSSPCNSFPIALTQFIPLPEHCFTDIDPTTITSGLDFFVDPVCSGMYKTDCVNEDGDLELVHNPHYLGKYSDIEKVILFGDYENMHISYYATNNVTEMVSYRSMPGFVEYDINVQFYRYFTFNLMAGFEQPEMIALLDDMGNKVLDDNGQVIMVASEEKVVYDDDRPENYPMQNLQLRQAISLAIDRENILKDVYIKAGTYDFLEAGSQEYSDFLTDYNLTKAKQLLDESGYDLSRPLTIGHYHTDNNSLAFLSRVKESLEEIGLKIIIKPLSNTDLSIDKEYDFYMKAYAAYTSIDWYNEYLSSNEFLHSIIGTDEFDELLKELNGATSDAEYNEIMRKLQDLDQATMYKIPLLSLNYSAYINSNRISVPDDIEFGNIRYRSALRLDEWKIKKA